MLFFLVFPTRREQWHLFSSYASWQHLVAQTKRQARERAVLSDIYSNTIIQRLGQVSEEVQRIYKRVSHSKASALIAAQTTPISRFRANCFA